MGEVKVRPTHPRARTHTEHVGCFLFHSQLPNQSLDTRVDRQGYVAVDRPRKLRRVTCKRVDRVRAEAKQHEQQRRRTPGHHRLPRAVL